MLLSVLRKRRNTPGRVGVDGRSFHEQQGEGKAIVPPLASLFCIAIPCPYRYLVGLPFRTTVRYHGEEEISLYA